MVMASVNGSQFDRAKVLGELKTIMNSDDLQMDSVVDRDDQTVAITLKVPISKGNFDQVNRLVAMSVDAAL